MSLRELVTAELEDFLKTILGFGYQAANNLVRSEPLLNWKEGREIRPYLRKVAIDYFGSKNAYRVSGLVPVIEKNKNGIWSHLELNYGLLIILVNHLGTINGKPEEFPRKASFRQRLAENNTLQMDLLKNNEEQKPGSRIFAILAHEGNEIPERAKLIVPDSVYLNSLESLEIDLKRNTTSGIEIIGDWDVKLSDLGLASGFGNGGDDNDDRD